MEKAPKPKRSEKAVHNAAVVLGTSSWQARTEQYTREELREQLSRAGKLGGRPRKDR